MSTSTKFYILTIVPLVIAFLNIEALGLHPITVTCTIAAIVTAYLGWRTHEGCTSGVQPGIDRCRWAEPGHHDPRLPTHHDRQLPVLPGVPALPRGQGPAVLPAHTGSNEYAIIVNSDLTEHPVRFIGTPDQLMQLAGQITTVARSIKAKEFSS